MRLSFCQRLFAASKTKHAPVNRWNSSVSVSGPAVEEYASMDGVTALSSNTRFTDGYVWSNIYDEAHEMMMASFMLYPITYVMRESRAGRLKQSDRILVKLKDCTDGDMTTGLHPHDFLEIVHDNYQYLATNYPFGSNPEYGWYNVMNLYHQLAHDDHHDEDSIRLMEFDDKQESTRLVYSIGLNKKRKRITVIFRGTYADETRDWARNMQCNLVDIPLPEAVQSAASKGSGRSENETTTQLFVHRGIYEYLLHNSERGPDYPQERYEEIVGHILACLKDHPDFKVFVCGHSLGGSLGLLLAFFASADDRIPKPVSCVSLGSLLVGDAAFQRAFEQLEALGWLRHLRVTNQHDPVPLLPPFTWYKPVGMHLELKAKHGHTLLHHNSYTDSTLATINNTLSGLWQTYKATGASVASLDKWIDPHMIPAYLERLERERPALEQTYLNDCYRDSHYVGKHFTTRL